MLAPFLLAACATAPQESDRDSRGDRVASDAFERQQNAESAPGNEADPEVSFHLMTAERLMGMGEYADALDQYLAAAMLSDEPGLAARASRLAVRLEDWTQALRGVERWLELEPESRDARQIRVLAWINTGEVEAAVDGLAALIEEAEDRDRGWRTAAMLLGTAGDDRLALEVMDGLAERLGSDSESGGVEHVQSIVLWQAGDEEAALERALAAAERSGEREHRVWAAQLAAANQELDLALDLYRQARADDPDDSSLALAEAEVLRQLDRNDEALDLLREIEANEQVLYTLGIYLVEADEREEAVSVYERLADLEPEEPARHAFLAGRLAELLEREEEALAWYVEVDSGPNAERARLRRAVLEGRSGNLETARELLADMRREEDGELSDEAWMVEAELLRDAGRAGESIDLMGEALRQTPNNVSFLYTRAISAVADDNIDLAEQDLRRIIQMEGDNAMALNSLGYTLTDRTNRHREAYRLIERALELEPDDPAILDSMGWVHYHLGNPEKALGYLERALEGEDNPEIAAHLIEVLWTLERHDEARELAENALERDPDDPYLNQTLDELGLKP
ncbi:MAG: tetratricopeptide repeat protein [Wenzhouxiangella sp.]